MKRLAWLTDIHLNFLEAPACQRFLDSVAAEEPDGVIISGDTAEGHTIEAYLRMIAGRLSCPVWFVLGNHDFYYSSIATVRGVARGVCQSLSSLHWLTEGTVIPISERTALIGHDGWADGRLGDYRNSDVFMTDYFLIEELANIDSETRFRKLNFLGDEAAEHFSKLLPDTLHRFENVILVTHMPPFRGASWYEGRISDDDYLPHFTCQAVGEVLRDIMQQFPDRQLTVLCGHTHGHGVTQIAPNILVKTGGAEYGTPTIQETLAIE